MRSKIKWFYSPEEIKFVNNTFPSSVQGGAVSGSRARQQSQKKRIPL